MNKIVIVEKYPTNYNYSSIFPFDFDRLSLIDEKKDKLLKKDINLDIESLKTDYEYIILIGADPCKFVAGITSVTEYQGYLVDGKYLAMLNPLAVNMRPSLENSFNKSINDIIKVIIGDQIINIKDYDVKGYQSEEEIMNHLNHLNTLVDAGLTHIALDTETSALYPRDGYVMGISMSYKKEQGIYADSMYITEEVVNQLQKLINRVTIVFHNAKFDIKMLAYHFGLVFPKWEDTLLEHYVLDETEGSHGLKQLAIKFTKLGDYASDLDTYKRDYCKRHKVKLKDFTYDLVPFDIMYKYASLDTAATIEIHNILYPEIQKNKELSNVYKRLLKEGTSFLIDVEENGIPINIELTNQFIEDINEEIKELTISLYNYEEIKLVERTKNVLFNVNSTAHKSYLFFDILGLPIHHKTDTGNPSTDAETIEAIASLHPLPEIINTIMKLKKVKSTYLEKFMTGVDYDGRLRTGFNLHTTTSGRLSSSGKLNAQQLPKKDKRPKKCIEAKPGFSIVSQDQHRSPTIAI